MSAVRTERPIVRRGGQHTRSEVQRVALELFTTQGYEATSLRQIADELGINKASLYYHFASKEAILLSLLEDRGAEAEHLLEWVRDQPRTPDLLESAVLRWVDSSSADKLRGTRFMAANPIVTRTLSATEGGRIGDSLKGLADNLVSLLPSPTPRDVLLVRMAILSINAAIEASADAEFPDADILAAAHDAAQALVDRLRAPREPES